MNGQLQLPTPTSRHNLIPMVLSISFNLLLWTLGLATVSLAHYPPNPHRVVQEFPIDQQRVETLQRWVASGHDSWCRHANLVAAATLHRIAPEFSGQELQLASMPVESKHLGASKAVYTYHSLDGRVTYRVTLTRVAALHSSKLSQTASIWIPIRSEKITYDLTD